MRHRGLMTRRFSITVRGRLDPDFGRAFGEVQTTSGDEASVLSGALIDAAFLDGILCRLRELGLELLGVETSDEPGPAAMGRAHGSRNGGHR